MATEILKSFSHLQNELEEAKNSLKGVDENIKRLIGRDPSDLPPRPGQKRVLDDKNARQPFLKFNRLYDNDDIPKRRNPNSISVFKRLSDKVAEDPVRSTNRGLISKVVAAPKEVPSRQEVLEKQNKDEKFKARNRRMFGALMGTLQKFQQEECKLKKREDKRTQIEKKIEEHEMQEKEEIKKEKQELFLNRKQKQQEIKMIELKMLRMKEYAAWEQAQKPRTHFIITKSKPHIHYLPRKMDDKSKELLEKSKKNVEDEIEKRRQAVFEELSHIEERMKKTFESKNHIETKEKTSTDRHDRHRSDSDDDEGDAYMKSLSPDLKEEREDGMNNKEDTMDTTQEYNKPAEIDMKESSAGDDVEGEEEAQNIAEQTNVEHSDQINTISVQDNLESNNKVNSSISDTDRHSSEVTNENKEIFGVDNGPQENI